MLLNGTINVYTQGMTKIVSIVEMNTPPITTMAMGFKTSEPGPQAIAGATAAAIVAKEVIKIGRKRTLPDSRIASVTDFPSARS